MALLLVFQTLTQTLADKSYDVRADASVCKLKPRNQKEFRVWVFSCAMVGRWEGTERAGCQNHLWRGYVHYPLHLGLKSIFGKQVQTWGQTWGAGQSDLAQCLSILGVSGSSSWKGRKLIPPKWHKNPFFMPPGPLRRGSLLWSGLKAGQRAQFSILYVGQVTVTGSRN